MAVCVFFFSYFSRVNLNRENTQARKQRATCWLIRRKEFIYKLHMIFEPRALSRAMQKKVIPLFKFIELVTPTLSTLTRACTLHRQNRTTTKKTNRRDKSFRVQSWLLLKSLNIHIGIECNQEKKRKEKGGLKIGN